MQRDQSLDSDIQQTEQLDAYAERDENENAPQTGEFSAVNPAQRSHFFTVANSMLSAIEPNSPELILPERLAHKEADAIRLLYEAKTGQETELGGGQISAQERMRYLNLALSHLSRVMAMARSPDFNEARAHIEEIRKRLHRLKDELAHLILDEEKKKAQEKDKKAEEDRKANEEAVAKKKAAALAGKT